MKTRLHVLLAIATLLLFVSCSSTSITGLPPRSGNSALLGGHVSILIPGQIGGVKQILAVMLTNCDTGAHHIINAIKSDSPDSGFAGKFFIQANVPPGKYAPTAFVIRVGIAGWYGTVFIPVPDHAIIITAAREKISYLGTYQLTFDGGTKGIIYIMKGETRECVVSPYRIVQIDRKPEHRWLDMVDNKIYAQIIFDPSNTRLIELKRDNQYLPPSAREEFMLKVNELIEKTKREEWR